MRPTAPPPHLLPTRLVRPAPQTHTTSGSWCCCTASRRSLPPRSALKVRRVSSHPLDSACRAHGNRGRFLGTAALSQRVGAVREGAEHAIARCVGARPIDMRRSRGACWVGCLVLHARQPHAAMAAGPWCPADAPQPPGLLSNPRPGLGHPSATLPALALSAPADTHALASRQRAERRIMAPATGCHLRRPAGTSPVRHLPPNAPTLQRPATATTCQRAVPPGLPSASSSCPRRGASSGTPSSG